MCLTANPTCECTRSIVQLPVSSLPATTVLMCLLLVISRRIRTVVRFHQKHSIQEDRSPLSRIKAMVKALELPQIEPDAHERVDAARNRDRILCTAARLFSERGAACVSMDEVAE